MISKSRIFLLIFLISIFTPYLIESQRIIGLRRGFGQLRLGWGAPGPIRWRGWYPGRFWYDGSWYPYYSQWDYPYYICSNGNCPR